MKIQQTSHMIEKVSLKTGTTFAKLPNKFEAGTPHIAGSIGLGAAIEYFNSIPLNDIKTWEDELLSQELEVGSEIGHQIAGATDKRVN